MHVFLAEDVGRAFVASGQSSAPRRNRERFLQPMSGGRAPHTRPSQSGGRHESPDNPRSNQVSGGEKKLLPPKEEECGGLDKRSADGVVVAGAFCRQRGLWLVTSVLQTVVVVAGAVWDSGDRG